MKVKSRIIKALGGYTQAEWDEERRRNSPRRPILIDTCIRTMPVRVRCDAHATLSSDMNDKAFQENMAYRIGIELLRSGLISFRLISDFPDQLPVVRAEVWAFTRKEE